MNFTPDQTRAIHSFDRNLIVVAGAGSGKTAVLVQRYLALLDAHPDWPLNALVAITFTEKAAGEMRDRVRQALEERLNAATSDETRALWAARVGAMDSARIDTFHSLCAAILRANAAEAGIDPGFTILDEVNARVLLDNVIDDALRAMVAERDPAVRLFSEYNAADIRAALIQFTRADLPPLPDDLTAHWQAAWAESARTLVDALLNTAGVAFRQWQPSVGLWPADSQDKLLVGWQTALDVLDRLPHASGRDVADLLTTLSTIKTHLGSTKNWGGQDGLNEAKAALGALVSRAKALVTAIGLPPSSTLDERAAKLLPLWAALIRRVQTMYRAAKAASAALDFDDLEVRTRDLLLTNAGVRARYAGAEFKHVLVDEFQDTNEAQWDIVRALADPAIPGGLFLVGDARQSIYAFRGADVSVFERVRVRLTDSGGAHSEVTLSRSFRTHRTLVSCFNWLFAQILTRDEASPARDYQITLGAPMDAFRDEAPCDEAALELLLIERPTQNDPSSAASRRAQEAKLLAARIAELVAEGRPVFDRRAGTHRPIGYGDVALLFQSMSHVTVYENALKRAGLPFVTVAGRGYFDRQEVWDLINLLKALYNPSDDLSLAGVLRSPLFSLSDDALLAMRLNGDNGKPPPLWAALIDAGAGHIASMADDDRARAEFAANCLGELRDLAGRITIAELLRMALDQTGYLATLTGLPDGARLRANVEKLLDKATTSGLHTLGAFTQYLKDLTDIEAREGEALLDVEGAITLMTVHAAKGLEFPLVVLVDASWARGNPTTPLLALDPVYGLACKVLDETQGKPVDTTMTAHAHALQAARDDAERRRLLYVAATRAQDYLIVSGEVKRDARGNISAKGWLNWLLGALALPDFAPGDDRTVAYEWGELRLRVVAGQPDTGDTREPSDRSAWNANLPLSAAASPPLLAEPPVSRDAQVRSLSATQVADLGAIDLPGEGNFYRRRLRRSLFYDAPAHIEQVIAPGQWVSNAKIGDMVHKALRWWQFPTESDDLERLLRGYAWEAGISEPVQVAVAVQTARRLLKRMQASEVYAWLTEAQAVYREVPFVYGSGERTVHGVIDVIFQRPDGTWVVLDYKTVAVPNANEPTAIAEHAARYVLRLGVYAAATREQLRRISGVDVIPEAVLYYIHHGAVVPISLERWQAALADFDVQISKLLGQTR